MRRAEAQVASTSPAPRPVAGETCQLDADKRALTASAEVEERIDEQNVEVSFDAPE